jgi:hypothetical protein
MHVLVAVVATLLLVFLSSYFLRRSEQVKYDRLSRLREEGAARRRAMVAASRKRFEFEESLVRFWEVRVAFVRHPALQVPDSVLPAEGEAGVLAYGLDSPVPIVDLGTTLEGICATLSFSRAPCQTFVPWEAVVGVRGYGERVTPSPQSGAGPVTRSGR